MSIYEFTQWGGCFFGVIGSLLLARRMRWAGWGFVCYLASNMLWIVYAVVTKAPGLAVQQILFTATSSLGVWNWLIRKPAPTAD
jgi:hypothetical protein